MKMVKFYGVGVNTTTCANKWFFFFFFLGGGGVRIPGWSTFILLLYKKTLFLSFFFLPLLFYFISFLTADLLTCYNCLRQTTSTDTSITWQKWPLKLALTIAGIVVYRLSQQRMQNAETRLFLMKCSKERQDWFKHTHTHTHTHRDRERERERERATDDNDK